MVAGFWRSVSAFGVLDRLRLDGSQRWAELFARPKQSAAMNRSAGSVDAPSQRLALGQGHCSWPAVARVSVRRGRPRHAGGMNGDRTQAARGTMRPADSLTAVASRHRS